MLGDVVTLLDDPVDFANVDNEARCVKCGQTAGEHVVRTTANQYQGLCKFERSPDNGMQETEADEKE